MSEKIVLCKNCKNYSKLVNHNSYLFCVYKVNTDKFDFIEGGIKQKTIKWYTRDIVKDNTEDIIDTFPNKEGKCPHYKPSIWAYLRYYFDLNKSIKDL